MFARASAILRQAIANRAFPGASVAVVADGKLAALRGLGRFTYESASPEVAAETIFDLASVSKVVATTAMAMLLYESGHLDLDVPVAGIIPQFAKGDVRRQEVTVRMLLAHSSGLPAYVRLYRDAHTREELLQAALAVPLEADPDTRAEYSDIGFIILGAALERIADESLASFCERRSSGRLACITRRTARPRHCGPASRLRRMIANFASASFKAKCRTRTPACWAASRDTPGSSPTPPIWRCSRTACCKAAVRFCVRTRWSYSPGVMARARGRWDGTLPALPRNRENIFRRARSDIWDIQGTSLWIDPERQLAIVLLTNRTWPDKQSQLIKQVRPQFHDAVVEALEAQGA